MGYTKIIIFATLLLYCFFVAIQGKFDKAEQLCRRSIAIEERTLGPDHQKMASSFNNLARILRAQVNIWQRSLDINGWLWRSGIFVIETSAYVCYALFSSCWPKLLSDIALLHLFRVNTPRQSRYTNVASP